MADKLEFSLGLGVDMTGFEKEWKEKEKEIQKLIDDSAFKIKLEGVEGLDKIRDQLKEIQKLQKDFSKPLTGAQALREQLKHEERARLSNAKAMEFEAGSADRLRRQKAQAELTELRLARAKEKSVKATNAQTQAYRTQTGVLNGLKQFMNSYISLLGGYRLLSNIKQITSEFELQRVSLRAITQDAQFADALFAKIKATATESPFSTKDLVTYTKQLAAYRIENEQLYGTMNMLADVSAGLGVSMDRLILAYGQVKAASVLRGTELRQFTEAGIPLVDELAKKFSQLRGEVVSTGEVFDLISTRQVPFEMVADIFKEMTAEGGRFYEMQKKQSESLYGVFENLKDNIQNA
jgi:tape measure domain-containing protein